MANIKELIQSIESLDSSFDEKLEALNKMEETLVAMRQQEETAVQDNVDLIVEAIKVMENKVTAQLEVAKSIVPEKGDKGDKGKDGKDGKSGLDGKDGKDGLNGKDGKDGKDGVSVTDAKIDFDGSLIITLSTGQEINVGEVVAPELQEKIKLVTSGGAGTVLPTQTGNANKYLKTDGTALSWAAGDGTGTVTSVGGTGTVNGLTLTGTVTTSGNLTLGGPLDLSSPPTIGNTTPSTGTFTTLTAQNETLKGTGNNFVLSSQLIGGSNWVNNGTATSTQNSAVAPDSTSTASTITGATDLTLGGNNVRTGNIAVTSNTAYTFSIYLKLNSATTCSATVRDAGSGTLYTVTQTSVGVWTRFSATFTTGVNTTLINILIGNANGTFYAWGAQLELGSVLGTYIPTTTTAVYGTPTLSFSGVASIGLQSDGSLYVSPAGTGALQAQATTSTATGGNARGANAVDWQTSRTNANNVASAQNSVIVGGISNRDNGAYGALVGGNSNTVNASYGVVVGGNANSASGGDYATIVSGKSNTAAGYYNFIGAGFTNSGTSSSAVTTQSGTMNATTAVTLSGSNASIKVGQYITGTSIATDTYVSAISGTSLTLSQAASGSSTSTLSFYTPHGIVVGGGNNQATGSYSFIGGGGDAGTAANRNVASGDWSVITGGFKNIASGLASCVLGGAKNTASGSYAVVAGGGIYGGNTASGDGSFVAGGWANQATNQGATTIGGNNNFANGVNSSSFGGSYGSARGIDGNSVFAASVSPIASVNGVSQAALLVLGRQTTDATATVLTSNTAAASGNNQVILPNNSAYYFRGEVIAGVTGAGNTKGWYVEGVIKRGANAASTALVGTPTVMSAYADAGAVTWAVTATADTTNGGLAITVTGQASTTIRWVAQIRTTEMTY